MNKTAACPKFKPKSALYEPDICFWWTPVGGGGHCRHRDIFQCDTQGLRHAPRADSDDDGEPD